MKTTPLTIAAIATLIGGHAWAADLAVKAPPQVPAPAPVFLLDRAFRRPEA